MVYLFSVLLGIGLAMDAFSVSLANGLNDKNMKAPKMLGIAGMFGFFQGLMPLLGWLAFHFLSKSFEFIERSIPYIALVLLCAIGIKMLIDAFKSKNDEEESKPLGFGALIIQGIGTSIDAFSAGTNIAEYDIFDALISVLIIAVITFAICVLGVFLGKKFGTKLAGKATILGGIILIVMGILIFLKGILGW